MLNEALRLIRVYHDLKQNEAAEKLGVSKSYLSEIENGRKEPSLELIRKYESAFRIPASSILFFSEHLGKSPLEEKSRAYVASKVLSLLNFIEKRAELSDEY